MKTYIYYAKSDKLCEPIGRVAATSWYNALEQIAIIKQLAVEAVEDLFEIQQLNTNGKSIQ
jgi:hypothetical protein